ncbi:cyclin-dependent kinase inhibitor 2c-related [Anaeramoeba ignava]|uniref:Cyclin-dependent kinase inhibitor 2c-related n=1 Tax=Anaeramoeba ignava TaxID=1746090 RepID=A0A9Q0LCV7_ANAIG|nr:cyclin-dependent kinase inhibitor 2c-related [Anaeramoeba ignava]
MNKKKVSHPLLKAIENGDEKKIQKLMKKKIPIKILDLALINSCQSKKISIAKEIIKKGVNIDCGEIFTPLHYASMFGDENFLFQVLEKKPNLEAKTPGATPLHLSTHHGHYNVVKILLEKGAYVDSVTNGSTPLRFAAKYGRFEIAQLLVKFGAKIESRNNGWSPIHFAIRFHHEELVDLMLINGNNDDYVTNGLSLIDLAENIQIKEKVSKYLDQIKSFQKDFLDLYEKQEFFDHEIIVKDGKISVHKLIINTRISPHSLLDFEIQCKKLKRNEAELLVKFLYSGIIENKENETDIKNLLTKCNFSDSFIEEKTKKYSLQEDLQKLYNNEKTKDFALIVNNKEIMVHKIILIARSDLFRGMFLAVKDNSNKVNDYSGYSQETINHLLYYIYTDQIVNSLKDDVIHELKDSIDYFQLNQSSSLDWKLKQIQSRNRND